MNKFYCNVCSEEVVLQEGRCPKCKTNWNKIISDSKTINKLEETRSINHVNSYEEEQEKSIEFKKITDYDVRQNINFFLIWAGVIKILTIVLAVLITIVSICLVEVSEGYSLLLLWISPVLIICSIIFENLLKWKAYMLYTNLKNKK